MNKEVLKAFTHLEMILELELQEMKEYLGNRFSRIKQNIQLIRDNEPLEVDSMTDDQYEMYMVCQVLDRLIDNLKPYVSNKSNNKSKE